MKKVLIVIGILFGLLLILAVLLPIIFKDDVQRAIDKELHNSLNAKVFYDKDAFGLSLIRHFPNITVSVGDFGIVGVEEFAEDTLVSVKEFRLTLDIASVIWGDEIRIRDVSLDQPDIRVLVLENGKANYDIVKDTGKAAEEEAPAEESSPLSIEIERWEITDGNLLYFDASIPFYTVLIDMDHTGSGDFAQDVFDMVTTTTVNEASLGYDDVEYVSDKTLKADVTMSMDLANMKFTFKENRIALNDFAFGFDGYLSMPADDIEMDITYSGKDINLKSVLSLIPGVYQEYMEGVNASGTVSFDGYVKGVYNDESMPAVAANFGIADGRVEYSEAPVPIENIQVKAAFNYPSADLRETTINVEEFTMGIQEEKITASLLFKDLEDYFWDLKVHGNLDLEKMTKVVPLEGTELKGKLAVDLESTGRMSDLEAGRYGKLPTSGSLKLADFHYYSEEDLPQGFGISQAQMTFDPGKIILNTFKGNAGKSDLNMTGSITHYMEYILDDSASLAGNLDFYSAVMDINEWMTPSDAPAEEEPEDTTAMEVIRIPENIDFVLNSKIDQILYSNLTLEGFTGKLVVEDGAVKMDGVRFSLLDGNFEMNGAYESALALDNPLYHFDLNIEDMSISSAFKSFSTVQKLVPIAEKMTGRFSTDFEIGGSLGQDMLPIYEDMTGSGLIRIAEASLQNVKLLSAIASVSKLSNNDGSVSLKDVELEAEIKGGRLYAEPFDVVIGGRKMTISGSTGVDGSLDYAMVMDVPSGQVGSALNNALSSLTGGKDLISSHIALTMGLTGTYNEPQVKLLGAKPAGAEGAGSSVKEALSDQLNEKTGEAREELEEKLKAAQDSAAAKAREEAEKKKEEAKEQAEKKMEETKDELKDKADDLIRDLFKRKKGDG